MVNHEQDFENIKLTINDWNFFYKIYTFFQLFARLIFYGKSVTSSILQVFKTMDALLKHYKREKEKYFDSKIENQKILKSIKMSWFLLDKYYQKIDETPIYVTIFFFDLQKQATYLQQNWFKA